MQISPARPTGRSARLGAPRRPASSRIPLCALASFCSCPTFRASLPLVRVRRSRSSSRSPTCCNSEEQKRAGSAAFHCSPGWRKRTRAPSRTACGTTSKRSGASTGSAPPARSREPCSTSSSYPSPCSVAAFVVNSGPHTEARPSVRLCVSELARCVHHN
jgi:hypothetical protein